MDPPMPTSASASASATAAEAPDASTTATLSATSATTTTTATPAGKLPQSRVIHLQTMPQRRLANNIDEDWTGKTNAAERRRLQNRLNQRARTRRKRRALAVSLGVPLDEDGNFDANDQSPIPTQDSGREQALIAPTAVNPLLQVQESIMQEAADFRSSVNAAPFKSSIIALPPHLFLHSKTVSPFITNQMEVPFSADHRLLTLLHENMIRALLSNISILGVDSISMMRDDAVSPFYEGPVPSNGLPLFRPSDSLLPPSLRPTIVQRTIPHHPEYDVIPYPRLRDNCILAFHSPELFNSPSPLDEDEVCWDIMYGVSALPALTTKPTAITPSASPPSPSPPPSLDSPPSLSSSPSASVSSPPASGAISGLQAPYSDAEADNKRAALEIAHRVCNPATGRTGFIIWGDPWLTTSWEVEEMFARKWAVLLQGCQDLEDSTTHWRAKRGEPPIKFA